MSFDKVNKFLETANSNSLFRTRRTALNYYFALHNINDPDEYFKDTRLLNKKDELKLKDKYLEDIESFILYLKKENIAKGESTYKNYKSAVKQFFEEYHIEFKDSEWKKINKLIPVNGKVFNDLPLDKEKIRLILSNADSMLKAFALTIAHSGQREEDLSNIELSDLHLEENPPRINNDKLNTTTKRRRPYFYITNETKNAIEDWLKQRNRYIEYHRKISNLPIKYERSNKLFPLSIGRIRNRWNKLLKDVDLDEISKINGKIYYKYRLYNLKSYFRSYLNNKDLAEYLIGHVDISNRYYKKNEKEIKEDYLKFSTNLLIYTDTNITKDTIEHRKHIEEIKKRVKNTEQVNSELNENIKNLEEKFASIEKILTDELRSQINPFWWKDLPQEEIEAKVKLTQEEEDYVDRIQQEELDKHNKRMLELIKKPKYKGYKLKMIDGRYYFVEDRKYTAEDFIKADFNDRIVNMFSKLSDEEIHKLIEQAKKMKKLKSGEIDPIKMIKKIKNDTIRKQKMKK